jgi:integrase
MVKIRQYRRRGVVGGIEVDVRVELRGGELFRERVVNPTSGGRTAARSWGVARERAVLAWNEQGLALAQIKRALRGEKEVVQAPTLADFWPRFVEGYCEANRQKPSTVNEKGRVMEHYLRPRFGDRPLDAIDNESIQRLKGELSDLAPKTVNNVLSLIGTVLRVAVEWGALPRMPARIKLLRAPPKEVAFYEDDHFERLVEAARAVGREVELLVLLGGDAGLRCGEILGLEQPDMDFSRGYLTVQRAVWRGQVTLPKGGRSRRVPLTERLALALKAHRHLAGQRVLVGEGGVELKRADLRNWMMKAQRRAGLEVNGLLHILRHTFCSRLAARNVPMLTIKELAGHQSLSTTQRYMHLARGAPKEGIEALEAPAVGSRLAEEAQAAETGKESK